MVFTGMRGLGSKISINLALLLVITMLATYIVMVSVIGKELIRDKINREQAMFSNAAHRFFAGPTTDRDLIDMRNWTYACFLVMGETSHCYGDNRDGTWDDIEALTLAALRSGNTGIDYRGQTWGVLGKRHKYAIITAVISDDAKKLGAGTVVVFLDDVYSALRKSQKLIVFYLFVNLTILLLAGTYRFHNLILRPIQKMIKMTGSYRDTGRMPFPSEKRYPELYQLSNAVHHMIEHIEADKNRLLNSVSLLKAANAELKKAQSEMIRAEKLASVGRLSAGLAHEIGNPIGIVLGYLGLLKNRLTDHNDDIASDYIYRSECEINRISSIVRQLLDFSRTGSGSICAFFLHDLIEDVVGMMSHQPLMKNVRIACDLTAVSDGIVADPQQLRQVLLNLMINAADAVAASGHPDKGEIRLATANPPENRVVLLRVIDNGAGIDIKNIDDIFDPFYTTKEPGQGTGLGLSVSYMIIEQIGGRVDVESEPQKGTTMTITLPLAMPSDFTSLDQNS
jgi:two-component system, NtrC family, sensor kinase